ncbi:ribonuclease H-like domain-containing protein [Mycena metata]|uniref:Ribonuclease H-like domain-containing protein n=1 Tax=Mycena metata TaxID=1033252 RepID=A0AAD7MDT8_9AGAR|nr:ribonuclease H-like domain-containing protein [Mycena metata]
MSDDIRLLRLYMKSLPKELEQESPRDSTRHLLGFSLDVDLVRRVSALDNELENAIVDFGGWESDGTFAITTRGPAIENLANILADYLSKYPRSVIVKKWLKGSIASASAMILAYRQPLPVANAVAAPDPPNAKNTKKIGGQQMTLTGAVAKQGKKKGPEGEKPDTKNLVDSSDPALGEASEDEDERTGGRKMDSLLSQVSKPWRDASGKKKVRCLGSAGCKTTWNWPRAKARIFKHVMTCAYVARLDGDLVQRVITELAKGDPTLLASLKARFGLDPNVGSKRTHASLEAGSSAAIDTPALKRAKTSTPAATSSTSSPATPAESPASQSVGLQQNNINQYQTEGRKLLAQKVNDALVELFVNCGLAPRILGREEFIHLINTLNGNYSLVSRTTFEDRLVPVYAANVRIAVTDYLRTCRFFTISGDGGKLSKKKFISVHITSIHRQSFCVDLDDVSRLSQTGEYFAELFMKIILDLREILAFMSLSSYSQDWYDAAREDLKISRGLQSVGETRFGTIYWSLDSVLRGIDAFVSIVRNPNIGLDSEVIHALLHFLDDEDVFKLRRDLTRLGAVLMPFARAIQCLESKDTTPADVYLYWLAVVAQLKDLIAKDDAAAQSKSKYVTTVKELIRGIANFRFTQLIQSAQSSDVYFTAFVLDPDNRGATILATPNPLAVQPITISLSGGHRVKEPAPLIRRVGLSLQQILQREYGTEYRPERTVEEGKKAMFEINPDIAHRTPTEALSALRLQLKNFLDGAEPFDRKRKPDEIPREWWRKLLDRDDADILAALAVKIFSSNPVSMPDERAMSTIGWMTPKVRNRKDVSTASNHMAIRGFNRMDAAKQAPSKPVTVNWRDIRSTIHGQPSDGALNDQSAEETPALTPMDPANDGLDWLNDGLPDLRSASNSSFDLATEFDIEKYLHILADSIGATEVPGFDWGTEPSPQSAKSLNLKAAADTMAPKDDEWGHWSG